MPQSLHPSLIRFARSHAVPGLALLVTLIVFMFMRKNVRQHEEMRFGELRAACLIQLKDSLFVYDMCLGPLRTQSVQGQAPSLVGVEWRARCPHQLEVGFAKGNLLKGEPVRVVFSETREGAARYPVGADLAASTALREMLTKCGTEGDRHMIVPGDPKEDALLLLTPVYDSLDRYPTVELRQEHLRGFVITLIKPRAHFNTLQRGTEAVLGVRLLETDEPITERNGDRLARRTVTLGRAGEYEWRIDAWPLPEFFATAEHQTPWIALGTGLGLTTVLLGMSLFQARQRDVLERIIASRTSELNASNTRLTDALAKERELSELKSNFVSMVSHEFRTPLGMIMSSSGLLENYFERLSTERRLVCVRNIQRATRQMSGLIEDVLQLGKLSTGKTECETEPRDLAALCEGFADEVRSATSGRCSIEVSAEGVEATALVDENLLRSILTNLLSNAVKYSAEDSAVRLAVHRVGRDAVFAISDNGIGIAEDDQAQLFEAFHRGSNVGEQSGSGLGLAIVKRCVDLHGGSIHLESKVNVGTTVTVTLPLYADHPSTAES